MAEEPGVSGEMPTKLVRDFFEGRRLQIAWCYTASVGSFRGNSKGQGFSAYLKEHGISRRRAYRLMELYEKVVGMVKQAKRETGGAKERLRE